MVEDDPERETGQVLVDVDELDLRIGEGIDVRVEDGRLGLRRLADDSLDLVVGDAFGGVHIPWHLTTTGAVTDVRRVLRPGGSYVANLIGVASDAPIDTAAWQASIDERGLEWDVIEGDDLAAWVGESEVLSDECAPVDQLLTPYPTR